jgi:hypothetical protein
MTPDEMRRETAQRCADIAIEVTRWNDSQMEREDHAFERQRYSIAGAAAYVIYRKICREFGLKDTYL